MTEAWFDAQLHGRSIALSRPPTPTRTVSPRKSGLRRIAAGPIDTTRATAGQGGQRRDASRERVDGITSELFDVAIVARCRPPRVGLFRSRLEPLRASRARLRKQCDSGSQGDDGGGHGCNARVAMVKRRLA